jgi:tRNA nucleotidyltransferase/poly(A) polymerase
MVEITGDVCEEFQTDIDIDFSKLPEEEKMKIRKAIEVGDRHTFKNVTVIFDKEVTIEVEPDYPY